MRFIFGSFLLLVSSLCGQEPALPDLRSIPPDLVIPTIMEVEPAAGRRVPQTTAGWEGTEVHHLLYLPRDWVAAKSFPVIVEYAGNGGYNNKHGDMSDGTVEGSRLGYGVSGGNGCLWLCLPFVEKVERRMRNATRWWGDLEETKRYCLATVREVCTRYGGDPARVVMAGFSRGSIGCNFLGLHDDEIARLWCGFICHSHYDGVRTGWPYPGADRESALVRLMRLKGRPQFISHEISVEPTETWLRSTGVQGDWTFVPLPFQNHSDAWVLRDLPERRRLREWFERVTEVKQKR